MNIYFTDQRKRYNKETKEILSTNYALVINKFLESN